MFRQLALSPIDEIENGYTYILSKIATNFHPDNKFFGNFTNYFDGQWMKKEGPEGFCVHSLDERTNNILGSLVFSLRGV